MIVLSDATDDFSGSPAKAQMRCTAKPHSVRSVCTPRLVSRPAWTIRFRDVLEIVLLCAVFVHLKRETVTVPISVSR